MAEQNPWEEVAPVFERWLKFLEQERDARSRVWARMIRTDNFVGITIREAFTAGYWARKEEAGDPILDDQDAPGR